MAGAGLPTRQDSRKFFENLSGAGKSIAVLTSGGDAQGNDARPEFHHRTESCSLAEFQYPVIKCPNIHLPTQYGDFLPDY